MADIFLLYAAKQKEGGLIKKRERERESDNKQKCFIETLSLMERTSPLYRHKVGFWAVYLRESSAGQGSHFLSSKMRIHVGHVISRVSLGGVI